MKCTQYVKRCPACFITCRSTGARKRKICHAYVQQLVKRALNGESDRSLKFGRDQGMWLVSPSECAAQFGCCFGMLGGMFGAAFKSMMACT
jgi:hypothetical protein